MTTKINLLFSYLLILAAFGCQNSDIKEISIIRKDFGKHSSNRDSLGVELAYSQFNNWHDLIQHTEKIACTDSIPKITLNLDNEVRTIYLNNPCWENFACILIYQHNTIQIHNDTISKNDEYYYPLDSIESVLKRDLDNNGKDPRFCEDPNKLLICISYDNKEIENLPKTLDKLTQTYQQLTNKTNISILLEDNRDIPPPLPSPPL